MITYTSNYLSKCLFVIVFASIFSCKQHKENSEPAPIEEVPTVLTPRPPLGWNSFNSYGVYLHDKAAMANVEAFAEKLQPHGYEYYVIDAGWFGEYEVVEGTMYPKEMHSKDVKIDEHGLLQPSDLYFPNGIQHIIDRCHELEIKFGIHLMRGIPRKAYELNTPVKGTKYRARDIANVQDTCRWNHQNYGVDMTKPGSQEFYNSLINMMAAWGVDFIKYDDIVEHPDEVVAVSKAIEQCGRPIVLSLSPGGRVKKEDIEFYKTANMLRVTKDIWDDQIGLDHAFEAWRKWPGYEEPGFWIDMDMIPFGQLQLMSPQPDYLSGKETPKELRQAKLKGEFSDLVLLAGKGWTRYSKFNEDEKYTFITLRALSASPLFMGGDLPTVDEFSLRLITHPEMIKCNQNGVMGKLVSEDENGIEVWKTPQRDSENGWAGVFNRGNEKASFDVTPESLGLDASKKYILHEVWTDQKVSEPTEVNASGVLFIRYELKE